MFNLVVQFQSYIISSPPWDICYLVDWPNIVGHVTFEEILRVHKNGENKTMINNNFYLIFHSPIIREKVLFYALHE